MSDWSSRDHVTLPNSKWRSQRHYPKPITCHFLQSMRRHFSPVKEELCKRIQHCCATLRRSRNKRNVGSCWLKSLTGFKLCATTCNRVCKRTHHVRSKNVGSSWPTMLGPSARTRLQNNNLRYCIMSGVFVRRGYIILII